MNKIDRRAIVIRDFWQRVIELILIQPKHGRFASYVIAFGLMGITLLVRLIAAPLSSGLQYLTFFPAVVLAAMVGGLGSGLFAAFIGICLTTFIFTPPYYTVSLHVLQMAAWPNIVFLVGAFIICSAIDAMRRSQNRLADSVADIEMALQDLCHAQSVGHMGNWRLKMQINELHWSDETYRIFDIPQGTLMSYEKFLAAIHPDDREYVDRMWKAALGGEPFDIEHRILAGSDIKYVREIAQLEFDEHGTLLGGFGTVQDITQLKEEQLKYHQTIEAASEGFWLCDVTGRFLEVNDSYCKMVGYAPGELLTMCISDIEANESPEEISKHMQKVFEQGHDSFETRHRCKKGNFIDLKISVNRSKIRGDTLIVFVRDLSDSKQSELVVNKTLQEIQDLYNNAPCGYHSLDKDARIIQINKTELIWLGYELEEMIGRKISEFQTPSSADVFAKNYPRFIRDGYIKDIEVEMVRKDGTIIPLLMSANAVKDVDGNYVMSRTTLADITVRKKMESLLISSEARFRQLFQKVPIGIAMAGQDMKIFMANEAFCMMFGYSQEDLCHLTIVDLTHPDYAAMSGRLTTEVLTGKIPMYSLEKKYLRRNGEAFWGRVTAIEINSDDAQTHLVVGMVEDISEQIKKEEDRLEEVHKQRDLLVREIHHRIKNNLQGVVGLLRQHAFGHPEISDVIELIIGRIYSIAIIHGLQAQSQTEAINLNELMVNIINAIGCRTVYEADRTRPILLSSEESVPVALVLNELVTNACKHRSMDSLISINLKMDGDNTIITITNPFDEHKPAKTDGGQGLSLVKSLLPRKSANLVVFRAGNIFSVELKLSPPVTIPIQNELQ